MGIDCLILCSQTTETSSWEAQTSTQGLFLCLPCSSEQLKQLVELHKAPQAPPSVRQDPGSKHPPALRGLTHLLSSPYSPGLPSGSLAAFPASGPWGQSRVVLEQACCPSPRLSSPQHPPQLGHFAFLLIICYSKCLGPPLLCLCLTKTRKQVSVQGESSLTQFPQAIYPLLK